MIESRLDQIDTHTDTHSLARNSEGVWRNKHMLACDSCAQALDLTIPYRPSIDGIVVATPTRRQKYHTWRMAVSTGPGKHVHIAPISSRRHQN